MISSSRTRLTSGRSAATSGAGGPRALVSASALSRRLARPGRSPGARPERPLPSPPRAGNPDEFDPFAESDAPRVPPNVDLNSPFANSPVVQEESQSIYKQFKMLSEMQPKYNAFDVEGKRIFLRQMDELCEKLKVFTARYKLAKDDAYAQAMINQLNSQLSGIGATIDTMYEGLVQTTKAMREMLEEEERLGADILNSEDPSKFSRFDAVPDVSKLMEDPETAALIQDPEVMRIMQKCISDPEAFEREAQKNPKIQKIMIKLVESMGDKGFPMA